MAVAARLVGSAPEPQLVDYNITIPAGVAPGSGFTIELPDKRNAYVMCPSKAKPGDTVQISVEKEESSNVQRQYEVEIPNGVAPGEEFEVALPNGVTVNLTCPSGVGPGQTLRFDGPDVKKELQSVFSRAKDLMNAGAKGAKELAKDKAKRTELMNKGKAEAGKKMNGLMNKMSKKKTEAKNAAMEKAAEKMIPTEVKQIMGDSNVKLAGKTAVSAGKAAANAGKGAKQHWDKAGPLEKQAIIFVVCTMTGLPDPALAMKTATVIHTVAKVTNVI